MARKPDGPRVGWFYKGMRFFYCAKCDSNWLARRWRGMHATQCKSCGSEGVQPSWWKAVQS